MEAEKPALKLEPCGTPELHTTQSDATKLTTIEDHHYEVHLRVADEPQNELYVGFARVFIRNEKWQCSLTLPEYIQISEAQGQEIADNALKYVCNFLASPEGSRTVLEKSKDETLEAFGIASRRFADGQHRAAAIEVMFKVTPKEKP
jgi:hypothetical protein